MRGRITKRFHRPKTDENGNPTPFNRVKKKHSSGLRLIVRLAIVAVVLLAIFALFMNWRELTPDSFVAWVEDVFSGTTGGSFPVPMMGDNVADMQEVGGNLVLLTDTATVYYNKNGGESVRRTCSYAKPVMRTAGRYIVVLETGGSRYRLETRSELSEEQTVQGKIVTGAVSKKGDVAIVSEATQSHLSGVTVFSRKGEQRYQWLTSEWMAMDVSFSADGNSMSVVGCRAQNGAMQSTLMVFDLRDDEAQPKQYVADGVLYTRVQYMSNGAIVAVGDTQLRFVNPTGELDKTVAQNDKEVVGFVFGEDSLLCAVRPYGSQENGTATIYSSAGEVQTAQAFEGAFRDVSVIVDEYLLITNRVAYQLNASGTVHKKAVSADSLMIGAIGEQPLYLGLTALKKLDW